MPAEPIVTLWEFPEEDFSAWIALVGDPGIHDHEEYLSLLAGIEADQQRAGREVRRARFTVAEMVRRLAEAGWPNDPQHRAAVTGLVAAEE